MSVTGLCQICESAEAQFACDRCGAVVCQAHYDPALGLCEECAAEERRSRNGDESGFPGPR
ncbi:hypothetical protein MBEHAL_2504 [Halarchaeum acidiphilum MH1-52-1]|uniref:HIT-type domain-containing protein n=1 Tax=Halarchaeum acidiphilum MH1-52-1 TaxID=1261545 RepID=U3A7T7_9EURY|nr:hypothetical protein [Halarchaeum acidiphilum]GAD53744.1 hypothetical protein MBEHAL_2504 [Halarchaeum acidiphilum MH1-52-1]